VREVELKISIEVQPISFSDEVPQTPQTFGSVRFLITEVGQFFSLIFWFQTEQTLINYDKFKFGLLQASILDFTHKTLENLLKNAHSVDDLISFHLKTPQEKAKKACSP
jgi:hypothetical protein